MRKSYIVTLLIFIVLIALIVGVTYLVRDKAAREEANQADETLFSEGDVSPYVDQNGNGVSLESNLGKIIVVNSWASWSPFSVDELQSLNQFAAEYKDKNVVVIAINRKESKEQAERFLATLPALDNLQIVIDTQDFFYGAVAGYAMPETVYYDTRGTIIEHRQGAVTLDDTKRIVDGIISATED
jgi:thiol-disulfide isomerase/thioredoxin